MGEFVNYLYPVLGVGALLGVFVVAFRNSKKNELTAIQQSTIVALQQQIELLRGRIVELEKENSKQGMIQDTIVKALDEEGFIITIKGEMVMVEDKMGKRLSLQHQKMPTAIRLPKTKVSKAINPLQGSSSDIKGDAP